MTEMLKIPSMTMSEAFMMSVLGFSIVFFVLVVLMIVIGLIRKAAESIDSKPATASAAPAPAVSAPAAKSNMIPAKGSLGEIKLYDVDDRTAALIMAIVADEMKAPLNELRFGSIREKK